ncbi:MAG: hypothetical protein ACREFP_13185 [Acetobacteraceae bacterium]
MAASPEVAREGVLRRPSRFTVGEETPRAREQAPPEPRQTAGREQGAELRAPGRHPGSQVAVWLGWAGTIVLLIVLVWGAYVLRAEVIHAWPASERLYALLGIAPIAAPIPQ